MQQKNGIFLTIEGVEGVGKSTAMDYIQAYLRTKKMDFILTREPGGTCLAEEVRQVLLKPDAKEIMHPETELLLMFASRVQHIAQVILPALRAGKWVVSDRFVDASFAYQGGGRGMDLTRIEYMEQWLVHPLHPDLTLLLDAPAEIGLARAKHRGPHDRIEMEKIDFFERVRAVYLARAAADPKRFRIIDATVSLDLVHANIRKILDGLNA